MPPELEPVNVALPSTEPFWPSSTLTVPDGCASPLSEAATVPVIFVSLPATMLAGRLFIVSVTGS